MNLRKTIFSSLFVCGVSLFFSVAAFAAEEGAKAEGPTEIFKWINFAIVAIALIWVFAKISHRSSAPMRKTSALRLRRRRQRRPKRTAS